MESTIELNYSSMKTAIMANVDAIDMTPIMITGAPGCAKTSVCLDVAESYGIPRNVAERCIFRPSLRDPVDLAGLPHNERDEDGVLYTHWAANSFIKYVNDVAAKYGIAFLIVDELPQAVTMMQNALVGLMLDRFVGSNFLHERVFLLSTGNRVKDKAGAGRIVSQLGNRVEHLPMAVDIDAWGKHMIDTYGFDRVGMFVAYVRFEPGVLEDINPDRMVNGTMRSCTAAAMINPKLPRNIYLAKLAGRIPEGRAMQFLTFRDLFDELPTAEAMRNTPKTAKLPNGNRGALFAAASLAFKRSEDEASFNAMAKYVERIATEALEADIEAFFYKDIMIHKQALAETNVFIEWATGRGAEVLL